MQKTNRRRTLQPLDVRTAAQFAALASPVRDQIVQVVVNQAPWAPGREDVDGVSIREIAAQLGRKPASLYRHVDALVQAGLIREIAVHASGGRDARAYAAMGDYLRLMTPERQGAAMDALCDYLERTATHAGRESAEATRDRARGGHPDNGSMSMFGWLDAAQRRRLHALMEEAARVFDTAERRPGTRLIAASMFIRPVRLPDGVGEEP
jgi:AcrR family transcriptional regulator